MKKIKEDIAKGSFERAYLLYGNEGYLKKLYLNKLRTAMLADTDEMNLSYYEGKPVWLRELKDIADTVPFFAEKRVIICENTGLFKEANDLADSIKDFPDTTCFIFVETDVDKRSKLYKAVKETGYPCEMNTMTPPELKAFIISCFRKREKSIPDADAMQLLELLGNDMNHIENEIEKVCSYAIEKPVIRLSDCMDIITVSVTSHIFKMIDLIALRKQGEAIALYNELLKLRQAPMSILFNIAKHFDALLRIGKMTEEHATDAEIIRAGGILDWKLREYKRQLREIGTRRAEQALWLCVDTEERIKTGNITEQLAVEMLIVKLSS